MKRWSVIACMALLIGTTAQANSMGGVGVMMEGSRRTPAQETRRPSRSLASQLSLETTSATLNGTYGKPRGALGASFPLTFGPKVSGLGLPSPFRVGIEAKWDNRFGLGFDYGLLPLTGMLDSKVKLTSWVGTVRYYPWRGPFYVGLGAGKQQFVGSRSADFSGTTYTVTLDMSSAVLVPQVGWRWIWESGFYLGVEAGLQVPISSTKSIKSDASQVIQSTGRYTDLMSFVDRQASVLGGIPLPHFAVLQIGYFF